MYLHYIADIIRSASRRHGSSLSSIIITLITILLLIEYIHLKQILNYYISLVEMKADTMNQIKEIALSVVVLKNEEFNTSGEQLTVADVHVHHAESDDTIKGSFSSNSASSEVSTT